ncbi:MAG: hypothetical protein ACFFBP_08505 [Promethearchaeota archaeon]
MTDILENIYKIPKKHIEISIKAFSLEDVSVRGTLIVDRTKKTNFSFILDRFNIVDRFFKKQLFLFSTNINKH